MKNDITPESIGKILRPHECVLIGTNERGIHGAGIAAYAMQNWGAVFGQGFGPQGQCFGLPTKDWDIDTLPLWMIKFYVYRFIAFTRLKRSKTTQFLVTKVGTGLAGLSIEDIAPFFIGLHGQENVSLPKEFQEIYEAPLKTTL